MCLGSRLASTARKYGMVVLHRGTWVHHAVTAIQRILQFVFLRVYAYVETTYCTAVESIYYERQWK
jgi:hypothetical protein